MIQINGMQNPMVLWKIAPHFMFSPWFSAATLLPFHKNKAVHTETYLDFEVNGLARYAEDVQQYVYKNSFSCYL